jgi:hypothetical protein
LPRKTARTPSPRAAAEATRSAVRTRG